MQVLLHGILSIAMSGLRRMSSVAKGFVIQMGSGEWFTKDGSILRIVL